MKNTWLINLTSFACLIVSGILISGCNNQPKPAIVTNATPPKPVLMDPFRYHKLIEVSPGEDYDILSWGRGSSKVGAFEILHSDSAGNKYSTTTGDLDGAIVDVFNTDMDLDGNPEILIQTKTNDTLYNTHVFAFEFTNGKADKLDFPKLTEQQKQGYRGNDSFYVKDGKLEREFPLYTGSGKLAKPTGQKRQLEYGMRNNQFNVHTLSKDSTKVSPVVKPVVKPQSTASKPVKHTTEKKKKKKHRRHHSDEG
ncbi:hypothetical protein [Mucilaginibacter gotjawali]|uniref:Uncharacterized protein n=2 Tax=Mucilaginibacter gotjawali TaxID=1550579 RepID=A0A0X8X2T5_9SPHI|nr:hypothetical protein [Mucilaginibacter gotjawali]MBB3053858.1 hypothetical protein [Mucilaginibacter gotjawali]BAU54122.1 hypothetical protein MgSA37_02294 [Mucilaginibacter gotjawali]